MAQQPELKIVDIDRPELCETFADSFQKLAFDGQSWRLEFQVTRLDEPKGGVMQARRFPVCRLALTPKAGLELAAKLKGFVEMLEKQGIIKTMPAASIITPQSDSKPS